MKRVKLYTFSRDGHHSAYDLVLESVFKGIGINVVGTNFRGTSNLFTMTDGNLIRLFYVYFSSIPNNRTTVGLFFRPNECVERTSSRHLIKYFLYKILKLLPRLEILTIVPFYLNEKFSLAANDWIHDIQFWDLAYLPKPSIDEEMAAKIKSHANGRRICVALGAQNSDKGFDFFAKLWLSSVEIREKFLFVAAGKVASDLTPQAEKIKSLGGVIIDRYVTDDEMFTLYDAADCVWSCYGSRYNQSSGILGRAFQLGKPSVVRSGSYMEKLSEALAHPVLGLPYDDTTDAISKLLKWQPDIVDLNALNVKIEQMRERDVKVLLSSLGLEPERYKSPVSQASA